MNDKEIRITLQIRGKRKIHFEKAEITAKKDRQCWYDCTKCLYLAKKRSMKSSEKCLWKGKTKHRHFGLAQFFFSISPHLRTDYINADSHGISYVCFLFFFLHFVQHFTLFVWIKFVGYCVRALPPKLHVICKQRNICHFGLVETKWDIFRLLHSSTPQTLKSLIFSGF